MATDPDIQRELEANRQRKRVIDQNEGKQPEGDPVDAIDPVYEAFVEPPLLRGHPSEAEEEEQRRARNDEES